MLFCVLLRTKLLQKTENFNSWKTRWTPNELFIFHITENQPLENPEMNYEWSTILPSLTFRFCNFATENISSTTITEQSFFMFVSLMTIVVPKFGSNWVNWTEFWAPFWDKNTYGTIILTQFNKWGGKLKKCL